MPTKRQRKAAGRKGAQTRKYNMLLAEGFAPDEIEGRKLDRRSFQAKEIKRLRSQQKELLAEGLQTFLNVRDPQERFRAASVYAFNRRSDPELRLQQLRQSRLERGGFTDNEIKIKRLETIPFAHRVMQLARARRRRMMVEAIATMLPVGRKRQAGRVFNIGSGAAAPETQEEREAAASMREMWLRARNIVTRRDEYDLIAPRYAGGRGKDYPLRLLDLVSP